MELIFLIGFMGCGKTTWSRKFAAHLGYDFIDLDHVLEEQAGITIAEYFSAYGEDAFRLLESEVLKQTPYSQSAVISTGGGLPCFYDNMEWMKKQGKTVYIKLSPKTLVDRLEKSKNKRPLLREKQGDDLLAFITQKLTEREAYYLKADYIANGISLSTEALQELIKS